MKSLKPENKQLECTAGTYLPAKLLPSDCVKDAILAFIDVNSLISFATVFFSCSFFFFKNISLVLHQLQVRGIFEQDETH